MLTCDTVSRLHNETQIGRSTGNYQENNQENPECNYTIVVNPPRASNVCLTSDDKQEKSGEVSAARS